MAEAAEPTPDPATYALAYERGSAAVSEQAAALKDARDRASTLITTASAIATIAIALAFRGTRTDLDWWGAPGICLGAAGFLGLAAATIAIWRPVEMTVNLNAGVIVSSFAERPGAPMRIDEAHAELALWLGKFTVSNAAAIDRRLKWFSWGLVGLTVETGGLTTMLMNVAAR